MEKDIEKIIDNDIDYHSITPCGENCNSCDKKTDGSCKGCLETEGCCSEWRSTGACPVYSCAKEHRALFCGICSNFPCYDLTKKIWWNKNIIDDLTLLADNFYKQKFDNHDGRIPYYELLLERDLLNNIIEYPLPKGYRFEFYKNGDRDNWIEIEKSAKEFNSYAEGLAAWNRYYKGKENELKCRMVFVVNDSDEKVATATAFYDTNGKDKTGSAWLHRVAVKREYKGKGLSKPLISYVLNIMKNLGYTHAKIPTQTTTWLACKIYLDFGFMPVRENLYNSRKGWQIIYNLTNHQALKRISEEYSSDNYEVIKH